ncbi:MAG TPA: hypothetical protein VHX14_04875 [Thermoanaerobaculia bacterium]|jgi:hypothetical protein|nr:hypothetical protein [Thermoanaerobaculia bacterium]
MIVKTIAPDDVRTADGDESTAADVLRSAPPLTIATLWSMIESDTESVMFLAEGGGEMPLFEPEEEADVSVDEGVDR